MAPPQSVYSGERARYLQPVAAPLAMMPVQVLTPVPASPQAAALAAVRLKVAVVESDAAVRSMLVRAIERLGHLAIVPGQGLASLGHPDYPSAEIDCVLVDVPLPASFGQRAAAALDSVRETAGVVLMSPAPACEVVAALPQLDDPVILPKPFALADLDEAIQRAIAGPARSGVAA